MRRWISQRGAKRALVIDQFFELVARFSIPPKKYALAVDAFPVAQTRMFVRSGCLELGPKLGKAQNDALCPHHHSLFYFEARSRERIRGRALGKICVKIRTAEV